MAAAVRFAIPEPLEAVSKPLTVRPVRVPSEVMFGWDGCETTRAIFAWATFPTILLACRALRAAPFAATFVMVASPRT